MKRNLLLPIIGGLLLFSCQNEPGGPEYETKLPLNSVKAQGIVNAPPQSGMIVYRGEFGGGWIIVDQKLGLTAILGVDNEEFCSTFDPSAFDIINFQDALIPNEELRVITISVGEVTATVYEGTFMFDEFICDFLAGTDIVAKGMATMLYTDNDLYAFLESNNNNAMNVFGQSAHGLVETPEGEELILNVTGRYRWDKVDPNSFVEIVNIQLR